MFLRLATFNGELGLVEYSGDKNTWGGGIADVPKWSSRSPAPPKISVLITGGCEMTITELQQRVIDATENRIGKIGELLAKLGAAEAGIQPPTLSDSERERLRALLAEVQAVDQKLDRAIHEIFD